MQMGGSKQVRARDRLPDDVGFHGQHGYSRHGTCERMSDVDVC